MNLRSQIFSAIRWTTIAMVGKSILTFLQMVILAHLLVPEDFGLMAIIMTVIFFAQIFSDMGVSNAIIHNRDITRETLSSLFWLNVFSSTVITLFIIILSPLIASFYGDQRLQYIMILVSPFFIVLAIGQQLQVLAEKNLSFSKLARLEIISSLAGFLTAIGVALVGGGILAFIAGILVSACTGTILSWWYFAKEWRPLWRFKIADVGSYLTFGTYMMGNNLLNGLNTYADILFGGRVLSAGTLGAYSLPRDLSLRIAFVVNPIVTRVGFPVMAMAQDDRLLLKSIYLKTIRMTASINFPIYIGLFAFASEIIELLFGGQWHESVSLLRILALWGLVRSTGNPVGSLLLAVGKVDLNFKWNFGMTFILLPILWVGSKYGAESLALSLLIAHFAMVIPLWYVLVHPLCGASFYEYFTQIIVPLAVASLAVSIGFIFSLPISDDSVRCIIGMFSGWAVYFFISKYLNRLWFETVQELMTSRLR